MTALTSDQLKLVHASQRLHLFHFTWGVFDHLHAPGSFIPGWPIEAICQALQSIAEGETTRLIITVPPRYGKSICASVALPAWLLGRDPTLKIMVASYGSDLAAKHSLDFRSVVNSTWYRRLFPDFHLKIDRNDEQITNRGGGRKAVSLGGAATGFGADIIIVDDLMKAADAHSATERQRVQDFYKQTLVSRLNDKKDGKIILIQQRLHEDDLPGHLLETGRFQHLNLPAIAGEDQIIQLMTGTRLRRKDEVLWPERESRETLEKLRNEIGASTFSAQYQQDPTPVGGNRLRWEWFGVYDFEPRREEFERVVQSWDTGFSAEPTSDFSACTTWGYKSGEWYLLHVFRQRLDFGDLKRRAMWLAEEWSVDQVWIEEAASGLPLLDQVRREHPNGAVIFKGLKPLDSKEVRFEAHMAYLETGRYLVPAQAPWLNNFRRELLAFPKGRHDDQVDSMVQFLQQFAPLTGSGFPDPGAARQREDSMRRILARRPQGSQDLSRFTR